MLVVSVLPGVVVSDCLSGFGRLFLKNLKIIVTFCNLVAFIYRRSKNLDMRFFNPIPSGESNEN